MKESKGQTGPFFVCNNNTVSFLRHFLIDATWLLIFVAQMRHMRLDK